MADEIQISGLNPKSTPVAGTDKLAIDDANAISWFITVQMLIEQFINPNAQLASTSQVTGLNTALSDITDEVDTLKSDVLALEDEVAALSLQDGYDNGNGEIQGNLDTKPFVLKNSLGAAQLTATENGVFLSNYGGGNWSPSLSAVMGISSAIDTYTCQYMRADAWYLYTVDMSFTANDSEIIFDILNILTNNAGAASKANLVGGVLTTSIPNVSDGNLVSIETVEGTKNVRVTANASVSGGTKYLRFSFMLTDN